MSKKVVISVLTIAWSILMTGCGLGEHQSQPSWQETEDTQETEEYVDTHGYLQNENVYVVGIEELPYTEEEIYEQLFQLKNTIHVDVDIEPEELMRIQEDYWEYEEKHSKSPIYRDGALRITIETSRDSYTYYFPHIGVRMKGNTSRTDFYNEEGQYNLIHFRLKFPEEFATLDALELKWNRNDDSTYVREYYAHEMCRDLGILAARMTPAITSVGDVHQGVFFVYEPIDKNFIERYVDKADWGGDLYKCGWDRIGANLTYQCSVGIEDEENGEFYNYDLKTNKKSSSHESMFRLLSALNKTQVTKEELESVIDMDYFLRFAAISYFLGNPDDIRYDYNNYYIYFLKSSGKAIFIPYDNDRVLGMTYSWNPSGNGMTDINPYGDIAVGAGEAQINPLFRYTIQRSGFYTGEYTSHLKIVATSPWMKTSHFETYYSLAFRNYSQYTAPEKTFYNASHHNFSFSLDRSVGLDRHDGNASFEDYVTAKMAAYKKYITTQGS